MDPNTVIDHFGGLEETAKALGITKQAVSNWRKRRTIPELRLYQLTAMLKDKNEMLIWEEEKMAGKTLPGIVGRRPKLTREQLAEVHEVCGSEPIAKYGTVQLLAKKFGCSPKTVTRARQQGYMVYQREVRIKSALCAAWKEKATRVWWLPLGRLATVRAWNAKKTALLWLQS